MLFFTSCPALLSLCSLLKKQLKIDFCFLALSSSLTSSSLFGASSFYYDRDLVNIKTEFLERTHSWLFCLQTFFNQAVFLFFCTFFFLLNEGCLWNLALREAKTNSLQKTAVSGWSFVDWVKERENKLKQNIYTRTLNREREREPTKNQPKRHWIKNFVNKIFQSSRFVQKNSPVRSLSPALSPLLPPLLIVPTNCHCSPTFILFLRTLFSNRWLSC